jgi:hypothetical protein
VFESLATAAELFNWLSSTTAAVLTELEEGFSSFVLGAQAKTRQAQPRTVREQRMIGLLQRNVVVLLPRVF